MDRWYKDDEVYECDASYSTFILRLLYAPGYAICDCRDEMRGGWKILCDYREYVNCLDRAPTSALLYIDRH